MQSDKNIQTTIILTKPSKPLITKLSETEKRKIGDYQCIIFTYINLNFVSRNNLLFFQ